MKSTIKLFFITIILLFFNKISNAQIEEHYHSFWAIIAIPVIVDHQEAYQPNKGDKKEKHIPDKPIYISFHIKVEDMNVNENNFSGISIEKSAGHDDIKTFHGEVSEDKQMIKYIEITRDYILYSIPDRKRAYIENKTTVSIRIEDIPVSLGQYKYKYGLSKITSVKYKEEYTIKRYGGTKTHTDSFVKVDEEKINKYSSCISMGFKPGNVKISNKINKKVAVIVQHNKNKDEWGGIMKGIGALMISDFMKIPDLMVLERMNIKELKGEIDLSQSGLVNPETVVRGDRMMTPDIEVIVTQENRIPAEMDLMFESFTVRTKIRIVETGQIIDANLVLNINMKKMKLFWEDWSEYIRKVVSFTKNFLYE
ncbi:MAG: hypothetical protein K8R37_09095 [Bacteroidales bacterium]|nr:hypothetical protein [Bacteroidales bacterium]